MKKILIMALALCWGSALAAPSKTAAPAEKPAKVAQSKNKAAATTDKAKASAKSDKGKTAAKSDKTKAADKGKTAAKSEKAKAADKAKTVAKADKSKAADKGKTTAKSDKVKAGDKAKTVAKTDKAKTTAKSDKAKTVAKADKTKAKDKAKAADKTKILANTNKAKTDKAKVVAKLSPAKADKPASRALIKASQPQATPLPKGAQKFRDSLLSQGKKLIGTPYLWGGTSPKGFDCSGLVHYLYGKHGVSLPRSSRDQFASLPAVDHPQPGDLVFFRKKGVINHVGIYVGDGKMLHAPQTGSHVRIESIEKPNWQRRYAGARRALKSGNTAVATAKAPANGNKRVAKNDKEKLQGLIPQKKVR